MFKNKLLIIFTVFLAGCATVLSGTTQHVRIKVIDNTTQEPLHDVNCTVMDGRGGQYFLTTNPGVVTVARTNDPLTITCSKPGYKQLNTSVGDSFNTTSLVNVLFWPGFIVDAVTGSYKKYPSHYVVVMEKIRK